MVHQRAADDNVAHADLIRHIARNARKYQRFCAESCNEKLRRAGRVYLADARAAKRHTASLQQACVKRHARNGFLPLVCHTLTQKRNFFPHGTHQADDLFHSGAS